MTFNKLINFNAQLTRKEAILFYVFYLLSFLLTGVVLGLVIIALNLQSSASQISNVAAFMLTSGLGFYVYKSQKKSHSLNIALGLAVVLSFALGSFAGLIPVSWMMTQK